MNKMLLVGIVILVLVAGGYFLFAGKGTTVPTYGPSVTGTPSSEGEAAMEEVREIAVEGSEFAFTPSSISVKSGDKVRVTFTNNGSFPHNFTVDELNVASETVSPGESTSVEFTASESGTFDFYCSVGNHRAQGMEGSLEVQ